MAACCSARRDIVSKMVVPKEAKIVEGWRTREG
jgi:hypothetical protein